MPNGTLNAATGTVRQPKRLGILGAGDVDPNQQYVEPGQAQIFSGNGGANRGGVGSGQRQPLNDVGFTNWQNSRRMANQNDGTYEDWVSAGRPGAELPQSDGTVGKSRPGGMANYYDDSWLQLLRGLQAGDDPSAAFTRLLEGFKGDPGDLESFFDNPSARMAFAYMLGSSKGAKHLGDFSQEPSMRAFASGKGQIGQAAAMANQGQQAQLASMGLGRSGLAGAAEAGIMQQAGGQSAQLGAALEQQRYSNLLQQANMSFDVERIMTQLALGQTPAPMEGGGGMDSTAALIGAAGTVLGSFIGAPWLGAAAGGAYGATRSSGGGGSRGGGGGSSYNDPTWRSA